MNDADSHMGDFEEFADEPFPGSDADDETGDLDADSDFNDDDDSSGDDDDDSSGDDDDDSSDGDDDTSGDEDDESDFSGPSHVFFENEPLIRALNDPRRQDNDQDAAQLLFRGLIGATLIALIPSDVDLEVPDSGLIEGDLHLALLTVQHTDVEGDIIPMFTDEGALGDFADAGGHYVALAVRDLFPLLASTGVTPSIVVNPGGSEALLLTPSMVNDIVAKVKGYRPISITDGTRVAVNLPSLPLPDQALAAVASVLADAPHVVRCYQLEWQIDGVHDDPTIVLAIQFEEGIDEEERRRAFEAIQDGIEPELEDFEQPIDLIDIARQAELFAPLAATTEPFFDRAS